MIRKHKDTCCYIIHALVQEETTKNPAREKTVETKEGPKSFNVSSLICYTDQNQMGVP